jgi:Bacterial protein of unknown function (DUF922)
MVGELRSRSRGSRGARLVRITFGCLLAVLLVGYLIAGRFNGWPPTNESLVSQLAVQTGSLTPPRYQVFERPATDLTERWLGSPALWIPPPIPNADIEFFDVKGTTQPELITSLDNSGICKDQKCASDPAVPNGVAWGLEGSHSAYYQCYSPSTTTLVYRPFILIPRWSPMADGSVTIRLVEQWNSLEQVIYTHEAGHVAIDVQDVALLNDQAHQLGGCDALIAFWSSPSVFDTLNADQDAYHARLHADCRPEIGCMPPGWMGW